MKKATIKDVAQLANVSISTVSNALNGVNVVKPGTRDKILAAAAQLNYSPNLMGKQLRSGQTNQIGVFTDSVAGPYFYTLVEAISHAVAAKDYGMTVTLANNHEALMNALLGNTCDGAIIFDHRIQATDLDQLMTQGVPTIMLDRPIAGPQLSSIIFDSFKESYQATRYLIKLGHRRLAFLAGYDNNRDSHERLAGFKQALTDAGLAADSAVILRGLFEEGASFNAVKRYLHETDGAYVSAFLAGNDLSAIGAIKALNAEGYEVPHDFSVVGFDDIEIASYFQPTLTTVRNPIVRQGRLAVDELVAMLAGEQAGREQVLTGQFMVRESAGMP
ncbi:LacI family DNA-binding transcriptional regulator [Lactiplantibacillus sp. WILCCON 0030]|uniref:LacI family DNA-binding transcriptional regulator n=1 Tax=Lactiplantibacillus brownii TaxID=3069269 RepID=A0ABU1ABJ7_9LACO|nr:LacI family DNA-binding transcriptional regulator [Lactiplantibacillus brownii]MDQ7938236.1 LacI family DNA-binding transcriptional regulator [Lactiplantibacillus brownii]